MNANRQTAHLITVSVLIHARHHSHILLCHFWLPCAILQFLPIISFLHNHQRQSSSLSGILYTSPSTLQKQTLYLLCSSLAWSHIVIYPNPWFFIFSNFLSADIVFLKSKRKNKFQIIMQVWCNVTGTTLYEHSGLHNLKVLNKSQTAQSAYPLSLSCFHLAGDTNWNNVGLKALRIPSLLNDVNERRYRCVVVVVVVFLVSVWC